MPEVTVGLLADPDLPARLARHLVEDLPAALRSRGDECAWRVEFLGDALGDPFEAMHPSDDYLIDKARNHVRDTSWDLALCLTDLPLRDEQGVAVATVDGRRRVALLSVPALGGVRLRRRLTALAVAVVGALRPGDAAAEDISGRLEGRLSGRAMRVEPGAAGEASVYLARLWGVVTLLAGMVRANRPWQLIVGLSTALAGSLAGTAFGVLYSSIWQLATALGALRLAAVTVAALLTLTVWIVVRHSLWERRAPGSVHSRDPDLSLRNLGTLATVAVGAVTFFGVLYALALGAVALTIPPGYLATVLARPADVRDYLTIALMATVLGTIAGAVGSGLENDTTVRKAAYGNRDLERRRRAEHMRRASDP
ncbi:hypothetical protein BJY24_004233 [Nocardia transvalensis]|uniref:Uncharacterized protein n=1 Tax=Nocardia transvalensis TaxID=37333 RepID=A0A7W9PG02_9NOCA|nr:hypothetical protein [Nocardia transvalensis]MBB5915321.1 hypothetical protein [Nocardia transvalensis]